MSKIQSVV